MKSLKFIKDQKGMTGVDITISILIIAMFTSIVMTLVYNVYVTSVTQKRATVASNYLVDIFEYIDQINYDEVTNENIIDKINELDSRRRNCKKYYKW